jgi:hypothetical protein
MNLLKKEEEKKKKKKKKKKVEGRRKRTRTPVEMDNQKNLQSHIVVLI